MQYLTIWDLLLTPIYLMVLSFFAKRHRDKKYPPGHPLRKYYMPGLYAKFAGAIFIALIYQYYYHGGDTYNYYLHSKIINSSLDDSFSTWLQLLLHTSVDKNAHLYPYVAQMEWYNETSAYTVAVFGAIFGLFNATSYMPIALLFAFFAYTGIWAMYKTFVNLYPALYKQLAIAFLFIPSTLVWGSAVFKDTICMFGLGWMTYSTFRIFVNRDLSFRNILLLILSFYLTAIIKLYILLAFIPALFLWLLMTYSKKIKSVGLRWIINLLFAGITVTGFLFLSNKFAKELDQYSLQNISQTASSTRGWIMYAAGDEGSTYDLGPIDGSIGGMLKKFPQGIVVTLFRPFPWEIKKVIVGLSAIEAMVFAYFTLKLFFNRRSKLSLFMKDPTVLFCLIYSIIFAFAVGISSGNFGALSRYKIPCLPFYGAFLMISMSYFKTKKKKAQLKRSKNVPVFARTL
jgi:hypothetical protein